jgi:hypothetical protein
MSPSIILRIATLLVFALASAGVLFRMAILVLFGLLAGGILVLAYRLRGITRNNVDSDKKKSEGVVDSTYRIVDDAENSCS